MKRITAIIALMLIVSIGTTLAQKQGNEGQKFEQLKTELNLSDEQSLELKTILKESKKDIKGVKQNTALSKEQKKAEVKLIKDKTDAKIQTVLSTEQYTKFLELKEKRRTEAKEKREAERDAFFEEIGVTETQRAELKSIKEDSKASIKRLKENSNLTDEEKKEQIKKVRKDADKRMKEVLTPEQYEAIKQKKKEKRQRRKAKDTVPRRK